MVSTRKEKTKNGLAQRASGTLSKQAFVMTVGGLEQALLKKYPAADAEAWDRTGLAVGDPSRAIENVAIALDPTVEAVEEAASLGANVLVTHHPVFLEAPATFRPAPSSARADGAVVWAAVENGVAVLSFHTALDVSQDAARALPGMLNLMLKGIVQPLETNKRKGYGQLCAVRAADMPLTLGQLAARCTSVFGRQPRVWGDFSRELQTVVTCTGSAADLPQACLETGADCLVAGEVKYHDALAASQAGLAVIDLGHDTSELPLVAVLAAAVEAAGVPKEKIAVLDQSVNWMYPETTRM